jgi:hypothetical protein
MKAKPVFGALLLCKNRSCTVDNSDNSWEYPRKRVPRREARDPQLGFSGAPPERVLCATWALLRYTCRKKYHYLFAGTGPAQAWDVPAYRRNARKNRGSGEAWPIGNEPACI